MKVSLTWPNRRVLFGVITPVDMLAVRTRSASRSPYHNVNINEDRVAALEDSRRVREAFTNPRSMTREGRELGRAWISRGGFGAAVVLGFYRSAGGGIAHDCLGPVGQYRRVTEEVLPEFYRRLPEASQRAGSRVERP